MNSYLSKISDKKGSVGVVIAAVTVIVIIIIIFLASRTSGPGPLDSFAQCLKDKGAVFYGAFWCPHCQTQKEMFGNSARLLPYVECSTPDGQGMISVCRDKNITSYPTWIFADGSIKTGEIPLEDLAAQSGCELPAELTS